MRISTPPSSLRGNHDSQRLIIRHKKVLEDMLSQCDALLAETAESQTLSVAKKMKTELKQTQKLIKNENLVFINEQQPESEGKSVFETQKTGKISRNEANERKKLLEKWLEGKELCVLFGGQGYDNLKELNDMLSEEKCSKTSECLKFLLKSASKVLKIEQVLLEAKFENVKNSWSFEFGLNFDDWIEIESLRPPEWYLFSAPVSYPLTLVTQFLRYFKFLLAHNLSHEQFSAKVSASAGHSQGIMSSVILASSKTTQQLLENFLKFLRFSVYQGMRCHLALFADLNLDVLKFDLSSSGKVPDQSPMCSVKGLSSEVIEKHISLITKKKEECVVGLTNGPDLFVLSGIPSVLRKVVERIKEKEDRRKVSVFFLKVGAAFHSPLNRKIIKDLVQDAENIGLLQINSKDLSFPLFSTEDGNDLRFHKGLLLEKLVELQAVSFLDYEKTVAPFLSSKKERVILDFGPGDGTAKLCRHALERRKNNEKFSLICTAGKMRRGKLLDRSLVGIECL